jgi:hypothetical protein
VDRRNFRATFSPNPRVVSAAVRRLARRTPRANPARYEDGMCVTLCIVTFVHDLTGRLVVCRLSDSDFHCDPRPPKS